MECNNRAVTTMVQSLQNEKGRNVVTIWGAGSSIKSGIPGGGILLKEMKAQLKPVSHTSKYKDVVKQDFVLDDCKSLEQCLSIYARLFGMDKLYKWLTAYIPRNMDGYLPQEKSSPPYFPIFAHEYCSFLAKRGLLKYFISLNFDEILEASLKEELNPNRVKIIDSRSSFAQLQDIEMGNWYKECGLPSNACFVFKPHGTISRVLTLRHIEENVISFDEEKYIVLKKVLEDSSLILFIGFSNQDDDFIFLLNDICSRKTGQNKKQLIIVDLKPDPIKDTLPDYEGLDILSYKGSIEEFFYQVSQGLDNKVDTVLQYGIYRQYIRTMLFDLFARKADIPKYLAGENVQDYIYKQIKETDEKLRAIPKIWFYKRIYELELLIYLFTSRGHFMQLSTIEYQRIKYSFNRCYQECEDDRSNQELEPFLILAKILNDKESEIFQYGEPSDPNGQERISLNTYWCYLLINNFKLEEIKDIERVEAKKQEMAEAVARKYNSWLSKELIDYNINPPGQEFEINLSKYLLELFNASALDVSEQEITTQMRFTRAKKIVSLRDFTNETKKLLVEDWNYLRLATVSADWFTKDIKTPEILNKLKTNQHSIKILSNMDIFPNESEINSQYAKYHNLQIVIQIAELLDILEQCCEGTNIEWFGIHDLQHHGTILSKMIDDKEILIGATYFRRLGKSTSITPVIIEKYDKVDLSAFKDYFDKRSDREGKKLFSARVNNAVLSFGEESNDYFVKLLKRF